MAESLSSTARTMPTPRGVACSRYCCLYRQYAGFSLFEMLIVISIAAILGAIAVPSMHTFMQNQRSSSAAAGLIYSLNYARSEAIKEDASVQVCASTDGATCSGASNWATGWIVLAPSSVLPLQVVGALATGMTVSVTPGTTSTITFQGSGQTLQAAGVGNLYAFTLCDSRGATFAREVEVNYSGTIQAAAKQGYDVTGTGALVCP